MLSARVISDYLDADYDEVYNNIKLSSEEIAFSALTVNSTADVIYYDDVSYINIEINFNNTPSKPMQLESYVFQLYLGQIHTYKNYHDIKKIIQICIDSYDYFGKNEFMYKVSLMEEKYKLPLNDKIQIIHLNIDYLRNIHYNEIMKGNSKLMKDLYFLTCNNDKTLGLVYEKDELMKDIIEESKKIAGIEKMDLYLTDEELRRQDEEYYRKDEKIQIAKKMLEENMTINQISKLTGLSNEEISNLIK